ncbi:PEP-CTERM sorting domain-containing protein [Massilia sp. METH4]|uniref:PEP-CTERM sorting domain-containing protein n=1 Tax=Massilia sp. METH4 TaxID=3123041 RepID=UPI0030D23F69
MMKAFLHKLVGAICLSVSSIASADIEISMWGEFEHELNPSGMFSFTILLPDFPTAPIYDMPVSSPGCTICFEATIVPDVRQTPWWSDGREALIAVAIAEGEGEWVRRRFYYFDEGALGQFGTYRSLDSFDATLTISPVGAVPEPASAYLLLAGAAGLAAWRRHAGKRSA